MRIKLMTKTSTAAITLLIACGALTGCSNEDLYNPDLEKPILKPESEYFDFATTGNVTFDVNYGKLASGALLEIYSTNCLTYNEDGTYSMTEEAVYKIFADENGCFNGKVELPLATSKVYIYSPTWGAPMYVEANVENGKVTVALNDDTHTRFASTRIVVNPQIFKIPNKTDLFAVVNWDNNKYGKPNDLNDIISEGSMTAKAIQNIQYSLWKGETTKPYGLDNSPYITDTKHVNTVIAKAYINDKGQTINVKGAEVWLTFLSEAAWHQNAIGYYYYPSDKAPASASEVKKYILFPNASIAGQQPYLNEQSGVGSGGYFDFGRKNAPVKINQKIQLLYVDDQGNVSAEFPSGYTIGYFIMPKEFTSYNNNQAQTYQLSDKYIYSNNVWNSNARNNFISLSTADKTLVYGIEDGPDKSYEDILFSINANPKEAIQDPERPVIPEKPDEPITTTETLYHTYAFEDTWPTGGDYDLNDVIIEHKRQVTITGDNYVTKVADSFTPVQKSDAAKYNNAFAVQFASDQRGTISLPAEAVNELDETSSVILFPNANSVRDNAFTVTRTFADKTLLKINLKTDVKTLNPFIISQYAAGTDNRTEVHLPKAKATSKANSSQIGKEDDAYYIDKEGKYPFAIMIPAKTSEEGKFTPVTEKVKIDLEYPDFKSWAESYGKSNADWYLNYQPSK